MLFGSSLFDFLNPRDLNRHSCHRLYSIYIYTSSNCRSELLSSTELHDYQDNDSPILGLTWSLGIFTASHSGSTYTATRGIVQGITGFGQIQPLRFFPATFSSEIGLQENFWSPVRSQRKASLVALNGIYLNPVFCGIFFWSIIYFPGFLPFCDLSPVESHCWLVYRRKSYQTQGAAATKNHHKGVGLAWRCFQKLCPQLSWNCMVSFKSFSLHFVGHMHVSGIDPQNPW